MKKLLPIFLAIFMLLSSTQIAFGATATKVSDNGVMSPAAYQLISGGSCTVVNNHDGTVNISGSTSTYNEVEDIGLILNLQYYSSGKWITVKSYNYNKNGTNYVSGGKLVSVSNGNTYRVFAQHKALDGNFSVSGQSYSVTISIP